MGLAQKIQQRRAKAISHKPDLAGRVHLSSSGAQGEAFPDMDSYVGWATVYESYIWLRKGLRFIADSIKFLPLMVVDENGEEIRGHYITELLAYVNDTDTQTDLWSRYVIHKYLGGEFFLEHVLDKQGNPVEVWPRRPDKMVVVPDAAPERRLYPRIAGYRYDEDRDYLIPPELMWFDKFTHPTNPWRGLNVIKAAREGISIDVFAHGAIKTFLKKGSRPDFVVLSPEGITPTERDRMEAQFLNKFSGVENVHKPFFAEQGVTDIRTLSHPPKDIQWLEDSRFARDETAAILNMPDLLMGFGTEAYDNSDKMNAHMLYYWLMNGQPLLKSRDVSLTNFYHQHYPKLLDAKHNIVTDTSDVGVLQENFDEKLDRARKLFDMGVPFEQVNERLKLGVEYVPPVGLTPTVTGEPSGEVVTPGLLTEKQVLNGAQIRSALDVVASHAQGVLPRENAVFMIETFFNLPKDIASGIVPTTANPPIDKSAEVDRFRRWAKKRVGKPINVAQFQSDILTDADKLKALEDAPAMMPPFLATDYPLARQTH